MIFFISDLHLAPQATSISRIFLDFLGKRARAAEQLFILGDLFEVWLGDDAIDKTDDLDGVFNASIVDALRACSAAGTAISLLHGNRDFLLGETFAARCSARLLPDPYVLSLPTGQFVLAHGDALCTDDSDYQTFRQQVRAPAWRNAFLAKPLAERKMIAAALRQQSENSKREKCARAPSLMDLNPGATEDFLRDHGYATFIHGHTHQPAVHQHIVDGIHVERWAMADWHEDGGECLCWDGQGLTREVLL